MSTKGVIIDKATPKTGVSTSADSTIGMVLTGVATSNLLLGQTYKITSIADAKKLGLNPAYDKANGVLVYQHIKDFYDGTVNKPGSVIYLMLVAQNISLPSIIDDTGNIYAHKLLIDAKGEIKNIFFGFSPSETVATGGNILFTSVGAAGDIVKPTITVAGKVIVLCEYSVQAGDTTATLLATSVRAAINAKTYLHGFSAAGGTGNVALAAPKGYGATLNGGTVLAISITGTVAATLTQFSAGAGYVPTIVNGMDQDSFNAIAKGQALYNYAFSAAMPCNVHIEGKSFTPSSSGQDLHSLPGGLDAKNVHLIVGQDWDKADELPQYNNYAAIGKWAGMVAAREVNENPAWVQEGNLTNVVDGTWINGGFSNHSKIETFKDIWDTIDNLGYIFPLTYANSDGVYWNDDWSCAKLSRDGNGDLILVDDQGFLYESQLHLSRVADKMGRIAYATLLPYVKSTQKVDPETGKLSSGTVMYFKKIAEANVDKLMGDQISGRSVFVDPDSDLFNARTLNVSYTVQPDGSVGSILVQLALKSSI